MRTKDKSIRIKIFNLYCAMYIPLMILHKILGNTFSREVEGINFMMNVIAIPCCIIYYKVTKKRNAFLFLLFYASVILDNTYIHVASFYGGVDKNVPLLLIFRNILSIIIVFEFDSIIYWMSRHKILVSSVFLSVNLFLLMFNDYTVGILYGSKIFMILFRLGTLLLVIAVVSAFIKSVKEKEFIEIIFICSLMIIILRRSVIFFKAFIGYDGSMILDEKWVFCYALYILPMGLLVECSCLVRENYQLQNEVQTIANDIKEFHEIDKLRTQFFANISHEMKTPINIIFTGMQLIESKRQFGEQVMIDCYNKYEPMIKQNCFRILRLTNNLVDMTKLDAGFMNMNFKNVDIVSLVEDITMSVVKYVENKKINIIFDTLIEEQIIMCDKDGIERIILNLISNAIKFTNENGNILVFMELEGDYVVIKVKDDGIGITKENRDKIFNVFVQGDKSLNRTREGSGIGLSIVKAIVEKHNGIVTCEQADVGTEMVVKLPNKVLDNDESNNYSNDYEKDLITKIDIEFSDIYDLKS